MILNFILVLSLIEGKFLKDQGMHCNSVIYFFKFSIYSDSLIRNLLTNSLNYYENGIFPYSAYFYKDFMEEDLKGAIWGLELSLFLLKEENDQAQEEIKTLNQNQNVLIVKTFLEH